MPRRAFKSRNIGTLFSSGSEKISVDVTTVADGQEGKEFVNLRHWVETDTYQGPTRKGVMIPIDEVGRLVQLLSGLLP